MKYQYKVPPTEKKKQLFFTNKKFTNLMRIRHGPECLNQFVS